MHPILQNFPDFWHYLTCQSCFFKQFPCLILKDFENYERNRSQKGKGRAETTLEELKLYGWASRYAN